MRRYDWLLIAACTLYLAGMVTLLIMGAPSRSCTQITISYPAGATPTVTQKGC